MKRLENLILPILVLVVVLQVATYIQQRPSRPDPVSDTPKGSVMDIEGLPYKGSDSANLVLIEFADYQCPYCVIFSKTTQPIIEREFIDSGKLKFVYADYPLDNHQRSKPLSVIAGCANDYWKVHDKIFMKLPTNDDDVQAIADEFSQPDCDMDSVGNRLAMTKSMWNQLQLGGTPSFAIGNVDSVSGKVKLHKIIRGAVPIETFRDVIKAQISS